MSDLKSRPSVPGLPLLRIFSCWRRFHIWFDAGVDRKRCSWISVAKGVKAERRKFTCVDEEIAMEVDKPHRLLTILKSFV